MPLDPQAAAIIQAIESSGMGSISSETNPETVRAWMEAMTAPSGVACANVEDLSIPGPETPIPVRVYRPEGTGPFPVIVFFHGGGWVIGSLDTHDGGCRVLANDVGAVVVSVDYRMAPEHRFPAAVDDCFAALRWAHEHAPELGGDPERVMVAGDSAGGNLAAVVAQLARDAGGPPLVFQLLVYPVTDHEFTSASMEDNAVGYFLTRDDMRWFYGHYLRSEADGDDPRVSPLRNPDLRGLPPAYVITAEYDPLRDQGIAYAEALRAAGNDVEAKTYPGMFHGFFVMDAFIDAAKVAVDDTVVLLRRRLGVA
jgi:acetyl esterase